MALIVRRRKVRKGSKRSKKGGNMYKAGAKRRTSTKRKSSSKKKSSSSRAAKIAKLRAFFKSPRGKLALAGALGTGTLGLGGLAYHYRRPLGSAASRAHLSIYRHLSK